MKQERGAARAALSSRIQPMRRIGLLLAVSTGVANGVCACGAGGRTDPLSRTYAVTVLPGAGPKGGTEPYAINDGGQIVGTAQSQTTGQMTAVIWSETGVQPLTGGSDVQPYGVNNKGQSVGGTPGGHALLLQVGSVTDLGTLGGAGSFAHGINDAGVVVGTSDVGPAPSHQHAFSWLSGKMTDLGTLGGTDSSGSAINSSGEIVGGSLLPNGYEHAFAYVDGKMSDLGSIDDANSHAVAVNDSGTVIGFYGPSPTSTGLTTVSGFIYANGQMTPLGISGTIHVWAINDSGVVAVGVERPEYGPDPSPVHAFLWYNGRSVDLNTRIPATSDFLIAVPTGINNNGQICALAYRKSLGPNGSSFAVRLDPQ